MLKVRQQHPLSDAEENKVETDIARILPPDREDLSLASTGKYGLCIMGHHTVAGVAVANQPADGRQQADELARQARANARQAQQLANLAQRHARAHRQGGGLSDRAPQDLVRDLGSGAISPNATAQELLELRAAAVSRSS